MLNLLFHGILQIQVFHALQAYLKVIAKTKNILATAIIFR